MSKKFFVLPHWPQRARELTLIRRSSGWRCEIVDSRPLICLWTQIFGVEQVFRNRTPTFGVLLRNLLMIFCSFNSSCRAPAKRERLSRDGSRSNGMSCVWLVITFDFYWANARCWMEGKNDDFFPWPQAELQMSTRRQIALWGSQHHNSNVCTKQSRCIIDRKPSRKVTVIFSGTNSIQTLSWWQNTWSLIKRVCS